MSNFENKYHARIMPTGKYVRRYDQERYYNPAQNMNLGRNYDPYRQEYILPQYDEREISVTLAESDFNRFMNYYHHHDHLLQTIKDDPILHDMYNKLLMMLELKR